ncbi:MAG: DUF4384 domain-containing protein [Candidatus Solibacter sp.]
MGIQNITGLMGILAIAGTLAAQQQPPKKVEGARDLFYFGATQKDALPPLQRTSAPRVAKPLVPPTQTAGNTPGKGPVVPVPAPAADASATLHLGFRYTVQVVNQNTGKAAAVDPDRDFQKGECVRVEVESNQSGYLYVMSKQSSGGWLPLFPSSEMPDESNVADPGVKVRAPKDFCFEISDPPGTESLFVVLSRSPRDFFDLYDAIRSPSSAPAGNVKAPAAAVQMASAGVMNSAVEKMAKNFGTRDLVIRKVTQAADTKETDYSVYVVNGSDRPSSTVVKKVEIKHSK